MSPVERTAAWVLNNGQYEEEEEDAEQNQDEAKHAEKVTCLLWTLAAPFLSMKGLYSDLSQEHPYS